MSSKKTLWMSVVAAANLMAMTSGAFGSVALAPGATNYSPLVSAFFPPSYSTTLDLSGLTAVASLSSPFSTTVTSSGTATMAGTLYSDVYKNSQGYLTFVYKVSTDSAASTADVLRVTLADLWLSDGSILVSDNGADGSGQSTGAWTNGNPLGITWSVSQQQLDIQFSAFGLGTVLNNATGDYSALVFFATNVKYYTMANAGIIDGVTSNADYLGPTHLPEPATMAVWSVLGLAGAGFGGWQRRKSAR